MFYFTLNILFTSRLAINFEKNSIQSFSPIAGFPYGMSGLKNYEQGKISH